MAPNPHANPLVKEDVLPAQLLYEYPEYRESSNGCIKPLNCVPNDPAATAAAALEKSPAAFIKWRSRLRHFARRFLNQIYK